MAIIDVPVHRNVGDLFILAATSRLLADLQCRIVYRAGVRDYSTRAARRRIGPGAIVVGLGGGNLGDVYPRYQRHRERLPEDFPHNRIVILPQTIHFTGPHARDRMVDGFSAHPDVRIAVRDRPSLDVARAITQHVVLLPDIVHALGESSLRIPPHALRTTVSRGTRTRGTVLFMRRDREKRPSADRSARDLDWPAVFPEFLLRLVRAAALMPIAPASYSRRLHDEWSRYADDLLSRGLGWMGEVDHLVTDRLHAAILARLAGRPVTLHDNAYGKLTAYYDTWWRDDPAVTLDRQPVVQPARPRVCQPR